MIFIFPVMPTSCPDPESGTTVIDSCGSPRVIVALCCSTKLPLRPFNVPVTRSIATYPADPFTSVAAVNIVPFAVASKSP